MTCEHNYMQSPTDSSLRFCCICGEPEPVGANFGRTDVCEHGSIKADAMEIKTTGRITYANWNTSTIGITIYKQDGQEDDRMPRVFLTVPDSDMAAFMATRRVAVSIIPIAASRTKETNHGGQR